MSIKINRETVKKAFANYTNRYDASDGKISLKIKHTYCVAELCDEIARSIGMSMEEADLAWLCGMLHDVGRFEQLKRFGTFVDAKSIDHAHFAVDILFGEEQRIWDYVPDWNKEKDAKALEIIRKAIWNHSAYRVEEGLTEKEQCYCDIVRDADKIDILRVSRETPLEVIYNVPMEEIRQQKVSAQVIDSFMHHQVILRGIKKTTVDNVVGHAALVYELVYPKSYEIVKRQGYLEEILHFSSNQQETREQFRIMRDEMHTFLLHGSR